MKYTFIQGNRKDYTISLLCEVIGVSRRGFYNWLTRPISKRAEENKNILKAINCIFNANRQVYGAPRIHRVLLEQGYNCSLNRVARLMRASQIVPKTVKKFRLTTDSRKSLYPAKNLLDRQFSPKAINHVWACDVTYIPTREGWLFLAIVLDLYSRKVVGWSMSKRLNSRLSQQALENAVKQRQVGEGLILHSDRGMEYYAGSYQALLKSYKMICSMSRKGNCWDNAVVESFFHSLKVELVHHKDYRKRSDARSSLFEYIELFYNRQRKHSYLNYLSPIAFEESQVA